MTKTYFIFRLFWQFFLVFNYLCFVGFYNLLIQTLMPENTNPISEKIKKMEKFSHITNKVI